jgi:ADP-heptose:LPS heptosyltransferase
MPDAAPERVLICLRYGIGDVVMEMPALRGLRAQYPRAHFTALGAWPALELIEGDPLFDAHRGIQDFGFRHWGDRGGDAERKAVAGWIRANGFHRVLDASHTVIGIRDVLGATGIPVANTSRYLEAEPGAGSIWRSAERAWGLSGPMPESGPVLHLRDAARAAAAALIHRHDLAGRELIALAPVASSRLKRWPMQRVCELVERLAAERPSHFLVLGVVPEQAGALRAAGRERITVVPPRHLQQTAALIECCSALLSNDTGLMHIGAAIGTPTVAVFGPTSPRVVLPPHAHAAGPPGPCVHRLEDQFGPPECVLREACLVGPSSCIDAVSVSAVAAALRNALDGDRELTPRDRSGVLS